MQENTTRSAGSRILSALRFAIIGVLFLYLLVLTFYVILRLSVGDANWLLALASTFFILLLLPVPVIFVLALLLRSRVLIVFSLFLTLFSAAWLWTYFKPKPARAASGPTLHLISFNMFGFNPRVDDVKRWLRLQAADIVLLQDTPPRTIAKSGIPDLQDVYPTQYFQNNDTVTLSKLLLQEKTGISLTKRTAPVQRTVIDLGGQQVAVYNVHLEHPFRSQPRSDAPTESPLVSLLLRYDDAQRNEEIKQLIPILQKETLPFIVAGDFNTSDQSAMYRTLSAVMLDSYREQGLGLGTSWPAGGEAGWPSYVPALIRIDYVWHSKHFCTISAVQGPKLGSDHIPLKVVLELQRAGSVGKCAGSS